MIKTIYTRQSNNELYAIAKSFWSDKNNFVALRHDGFHGALDYLIDLLRNGSGYVVNCDEDFFLINEPLVDAVIKQMKLSGYAFCGVPDGGVISHRNKSTYTYNPFFNVFNCDIIKTKLNEFDRLKSHEYGLQCEANPNTDEPFAGLFYWLRLNFKNASFTDITSTDTISTVININGQPLGVHSWYSREYNTNPKQRQRIDDCIEFALLQ